MTDTASKTEYERQIANGTDSANGLDSWLKAHHASTIARRIILDMSFADHLPDFHECLLLRRALRRRTQDELEKVFIEVVELTILEREATMQCDEAIAEKSALDEVVAFWSVFRLPVPQDDDPEPKGR